MTIDFSPDEFLRAQGTAAVAEVPMVIYLEWLLGGGSAVDGISGHATTILERLDAISAATAMLSSWSEARFTTPAQGPLVAPRNVIAARLQQRGVPFSTIRQVNADDPR